MRSLNAERLLAIEVGFEAVSDGFVQHDARPARAQHHRHLARGRIDGIELHDGLARGFRGELLGRLYVCEEGEFTRPPPPS